jgi:hypothetical protein
LRFLVTERFADPIVSLPPDAFRKREPVHLRSAITGKIPGAELNPTPRRCAKGSSARHRAGLPSQTTRRTKGRGKPSVRRRMPGAGLSDGCNGKALSDMPAFQPYWGKPAVRNDRGDGGNVGIIRSPLRATVPPDCGGRSAMVVPTATTDPLPDIKMARRKT